MANPEHVKVLKQGVETWNRWREENPNMLTDLEGANLGGDNLDGAFLSDLDSPGNLAGTDLRGTNLGGAQLNGANLRGADFTGANLSWADLVSADLSRARLHLTDVRGAHFESANLYEAHFFETVFGNTSLKGARGLDDCSFDGPCTIDLRTIARSWPLPNGFLRGCGLPNDYIKYLSSLLARPAEFHSCFISYSFKDQNFAKRLYADLQDNGVRCWFAPEDMKIGDEIEDALDRSIRLRDKLLLVLSENSLRSFWVEEEVKTAIQEERSKKKRVLFPIRLDDAVMDSTEPWVQKVKRRHIGDFTDWKDHNSYRKSFDRLLKDLKAGTQS